MKLLLLSPNVLTAPYPVYPIGLDYVAGAVAGRHDVRILDLNQEPGPEALERVVASYRPRAIGLSLRNADDTDATKATSFLAGYQDIVERIRKTCAAPVVLGGSGFTIFPEALMDLLDADYGIPGDGERIGPLLDALERGLPGDDIPGVLTRRKRKPERTGWLPGPFRRDFRGDRPHVRFYLRQGGMLNLQTKRGCPFRCAYCTYPHIDGGALRLIDPGEVAKTAVQLQEAGAKYLFVTDSTFNASVDHSAAVAEAMIRAGLAIPWGAFFAPRKVPPGYFRLMARAGLTHVEFGTESLSDRVLRAYGKPFLRDDVYQTHAAACEAGLHVAHYFLLGGPGEDRDTLEQTLARADRLSPAVFFFFCGIRIYPHTALHDLAVREGLIAPHQDLLDPVFYRSPGLDAKTVAGILGKRAAGKPHWVVGAGGEQTARILARLHARGHIGPLWERLIPPRSSGCARGWPMREGRE